MSRQATVLLFCILQSVYVSNQYISDEHFYQSVKLYYSDKPANAETVVGSDALSDVDLARSRHFIQQVLSGRGRGRWGAGEREPPGTARALDCGAGYGRVARHVLMHIFDKIDLVEQNERFTEIALHLIQQTHQEKLGTVYKMKVQDFHPDAYYDVIWIQWLLMYLTDKDAISLLNKCRLALKPNGVIILKENVAAEKWMTFDAEEASMVRSHQDVMSLVRAAGLHVLLARLEPGASEDETVDYQDILALALAPAPSPDPALSPYTNTTRAGGDRCYK
ncbi:hypothetical protein O0L34_g5179 [Tuta absoluta]|nr:hypothetical protein O0L34_g5179 [Tuta absoluta]